MTKPYPMELRERALRFVKASESRNPQGQLPLRQAHLHHRSRRARHRPQGHLGPRRALQHPDDGHVRGQQPAEVGQDPRGGVVVRISGHSGEYPGFPGKGTRGHLEGTEGG